MIKINLVSEGRKPVVARKAKEALGVGEVSTPELALYGALLLGILLIFGFWFYLRGEIKERGGGDAETSATTRDTEIARNPHQPEGWRQDDIVFFVAPPPRCHRHRVVVASRTRHRRARHKRDRIYGTRH